MKSHSQDSFSHSALGFLVGHGVFLCHSQIDPGTTAHRSGFESKPETSGCHRRPIQEATPKQVRTISHSANYSSLKLFTGMLLAVCLIDASTYTVP